MDYKQECTSICKNNWNGLSEENKAAFDSEMSFLTFCQKECEKEAARQIAPASSTNSSAPNYQKIVVLVLGGLVVFGIGFIIYKKIKNGR